MASLTMTYGRFIASVIITCPFFDLCLSFKGHLRKQEKSSLERQPEALDIVII